MAEGNEVSGSSPIVSSIVVCKLILLCVGYEIGGKRFPTTVSTEPSFSTTKKTKYMKFEFAQVTVVCILVHEQGELNPLRNNTYSDVRQARL